MNIANKQSAWSARVVIATLLIAVSGCAQHVTPSFTFFGALFPAWMLCALIALFIAIAARVVMIGLKLTTIIPFQLLVCTAIGLICALIIWILWFGQ